MEQRRFSGKGHWYHETQSNHSQTDVLPLVPEAANVDDRFLLDLALPDDIAASCCGWLTPARTLCRLLFPLDTPVNRLHTLSAYDRLSTALTVSQACGVQRLCNHYAALLAPLPGPDSSRESNRRLAEITQYARQLASSPDVIDDKAQTQLDEVGLTTYDIVLINQIIGFTGFQARAVAVFQALLGHPVRWLPGHHIQPHTLPLSFTRWTATQPVVELKYASAVQLEALSRWQAEPALSALTPVLCHEPMLLNLTGEILVNHPQSEAQPSASLSAAQALLLTSPDRFSAAQLTPLTEAGIPPGKAINLLTHGAFNGWLDRLRVALGKEE
ncbi:CMD domain-containing protein [Enterobacter hormaechei]|uniref:CMD domain-containing protein n=1 Tax=Enterobacter hormaechei TaxID=158836 RepID=UPI001371F8A3|nr:CMD domain-containing protein [Enterobacter hormaechei]MZJ54164.1 CMD domain-containing protein [Enterobacter hormaechei]MZJ71165.1 CMD domain-containing protein [Enterobacter hormaechei]MZK03874.1 CMD domain-containing protein [Enterobacter hormaechei]MZK11900.1 CMD domain-containing protein [Enterobacter hormaechei]MZK19288.1 CMD domain-containing protein [Enterobacter hormaechei]